MRNIVLTSNNVHIYYIIFHAFFQEYFSQGQFRLSLFALVDMQRDGLFFYCCSFRKRQLFCSPLCIVGFHSSIAILYETVSCPPKRGTSWAKGRGQRKTGTKSDISLSLFGLQKNFRERKQTFSSVQSDSVTVGADSALPLSGLSLPSTLFLSPFVRF